MCTQQLCSFTVPVWYDHYSALFYNGATHNTREPRIRLVYSRCCIINCNSACEYKKLRSLSQIFSRSYLAEILSICRHIVSLRSPSLFVRRKFLFAAQLVVSVSLMAPCRREWRQTREFWSLAFPVKEPKLRMNNHERSTQRADNHPRAECPNIFTYFLSCWLVEQFAREWLYSRWSYVSSTWGIGKTNICIYSWNECLPFSVYFSRL